MTSYDDLTRARIRRVVGTDPAADAQISDPKVPAGAVWQVLAWRAQYVTSATAGTRYPRLVCYDQDGNEMWSAYMTTIPASVGGTYTLAPSLEISGTTGAARMSPLPSPCILPRGWYLGTAVSGTQTGDNWGPPTLHVIEYLVPGYPAAAA